MNTVNLIGNATRDPELKYLQSGTAVCELSIAVNEKYKGVNGEWVDKVNYIDVVCWGRTAEVANEFVQKGRKVGITGKLTYESWEEKETGKKRSRLKVTCDKLTLLDSRRDGGGGASRDDSEPEPQWKDTGSSQAPTSVNDFDVPF